MKIRLRRNPSSFLKGSITYKIHTKTNVARHEMIKLQYTIAAITAVPIIS